MFQRLLLKNFKTEALLSTRTNILHRYRGVRSKSYVPGPCPLSELRNQSVAIGVCDESGARRKNAPWAFQLAVNRKDRSSKRTTEEANSTDVIDLASAAAAAPVVRTIGFQHITPEGIIFLTTSSSPDLHDEPASMVYFEGKYPPPPNEKCTQWRTEGIIRAADVELVSQTAPAGSMSQIIASANFKSKDCDGRQAMSDREAFIRETEVVRERLLSGERSSDDTENRTETDEASKPVRVYRFIPYRMEMLESGEIIWERFEWIRNSKGEWSAPKRLLPY